MKSSALIILLQAVVCGAQPTSGDALLLTYFRDNGQAGVCLAKSDDGVTFTPLNDDKPVFRPPAWPGHNLTRDASILYRDGMFRMVWTTQWKGRIFGYAESRDLATWSEPRQVRPFPDARPAEDQPDNIWAPEIHWDPLKQDYFILFASTIPRERDDDDNSNNNGKKGSRYDNRVFITRTGDFRAWSDAKLFFDRDFASIDAVMCRDEANRRWAMVIKCSRDESLAKMPGRNLWLAFTGLDMDKLEFSPLIGPIAGNHSPLFNNPEPRKSMAEGPSLLRHQGRWLLIWDEPAGGGLQLATSPDLKTWTHNKAATFPRGALHGTAFLAPRTAVGWLRNDKPCRANELDLGAMVQPVPLEAKFSDPDYFIWCGAPTKGADGRYHLYYSRWPVSKGFAPGWALCSEIAYAVAAKPLGPYKHVNVALPARGGEFWDGTTTHNPNVLQHGGKFYLFYMGNRGDGQYPTHRNNQRIGVAVADQPEGPWKRFDKPIVDISADKTAFDSLCVTNPAAAVRPDGGILLIYKAVEYVEGKLMGGNVRYGAALADKPEGPYGKKPGRIFQADHDDGKHWMLAEDPFIWFSKQYGNRYYAVARDVAGKFTGSSGGIALFQSDDGLYWKPAARPKVLDGRYAWADGLLSNSQLERPSLLFDGETPIALFGAADGYKKGGRVSSNIQFPLQRRAIP